MSNYRIAFLFCRALTFYLWWNTALIFVSGILGFVVNIFFGFGMRSGVQSLTGIVGFLAAAIIFSLFSKGISAALTGQNVLEGEAIQASTTLTPQERTFITSSGGLLLLLEAAIAAANIALASPFYLFSRMSLSIFDIFGFSLIGIALKALVGFFFAFRLNLKKMVPR